MPRKSDQLVSIVSEVYDAVCAQWDFKSALCTAKKSVAAGKAKRFWVEPVAEKNLGLVKIETARGDVQQIFPAFQIVDVVLN